MKYSLYGQTFQQFQDLEKFIEEFIHSKLESFFYDRIYNLVEGLYKSGKLRINIDSTISDKIYGMFT